MLGLDVGMQDFVTRRCASEPSVSCVLLDAVAGDVLALVSSPSFDPTLFSTGLTPTLWQELSRWLVDFEALPAFAVSAIAVTLEDETVHLVEPDDGGLEEPALAASPERAVSASSYGCGCASSVVLLPRDTAVKKLLYAVSPAIDCFEESRPFHLPLTCVAMPPP